MTNPDPRYPHRRIIRIGESDIELKFEEVHLSRIHFDHQNPRLQYVIGDRWEGDGSTPEQLVAAFRETPDWNKLRDSIQDNGLISPLIVHQDGRVIEGNRRLSVLLHLLSTLKLSLWETVPVFRLPADVSEQQITALVEKYHPVGKKEW